MTDTKSNQNESDHLFQPILTSSSRKQEDDHTRCSLLDSNRVKLKNQSLLLPVKDLEVGKFEACHQKFGEVSLELMKKFSIIENLEIKENIINENMMEILCKGISENESLKTLKISDCTFNKNQFEQLVKAILQKKKQSIETLQLCNFKINTKNAKHLRELFNEYLTIHNLALPDCSIDDKKLIEICKGIDENSVIQQVNLKRNLFEIKGFQALIDALKKTMTITKLELEQTEMNETNLDNLISLVSDPNCKLTSLVLNDSDLNDSSIEKLTKTLQNMTSLNAIAMSKQDYSVQMCMQLNTFINYHQTLQHLDLSHSHISSQGFMFICEAIETSTIIQSLNLSFNHVHGDGVVYLCKMLKGNKTLLSFDIKYAHLGNVSAVKVIESLKSHPTLLILDISGNKISQEGFISLLQLLRKQSPITTLKSKDNMISGEGDLDYISEKNFNSFNIESIDLADNNIINTFGLKLLNLIKTNYFIEKLNLQGNKQINYDLIEQIENECRKNHLIKRYIAPKSKKCQHDNNNQMMSKFMKKKFKTLELQEEMYYQTDFIGKFINLNMNTLERLHFKNISFKNGMIDLLKEIQNVKLKVNCIIFEACSLGSTPLPLVVQALAEIKSLNELHLIDMSFRSRTQIKQSMLLRINLKVLNLRNNNIKDFNEIAKLIVNSRILRSIDLRGNIISTIEQMDDIIGALSQNYSVTEILYDLNSSNNVDEDRITLLNQEIKKNVIIGKIIDRKQLTKYYLNNKCELNLSNSNKLADQIDAVLKLFRCLHNKTQLNLQNCRLQDYTVQEIVLYLLMDYRNSIDSLNISHNALTDGSCAQIAKLIEAEHIGVENLDLSSNSGITMEGMITILNSSSQDLNFDKLNLEKCGIKMIDQQTKDRFITSLKKNISLTELNLNDNPITDDKNLMETIKEELYINKQIRQHITSVLTYSMGKKDRKVLAKRYQSKLFNEVESVSPQNNTVKGEANAMVNLLVAKQRSSKRYIPGHGNKINTNNTVQKIIVENTSTSSFSDEEEELTQNKLNLTVNIKKQVQLKFPRTLTMSAQAQVNEFGENENIICLSNMKLKHIAFLKKFLQNQNKQFKSLDLSNNQMGDNIRELCDLISQPYFQFNFLNISNNRIGQFELHKICTALIDNQYLKGLNISENNFQDSDMKIMYPFLQKNINLRSLVYTLTDHTNIEKQELFDELEDLVTHQVRAELNSQFQHRIGWKVKVCLPLWCWRSFINDKHEAFRFKYDTKKMNQLEQFMIKKKYIQILYLNSFIYYVIMFICPFIFANECSQGVHIETHIIYGAYSGFTILLEIFMVYKIQTQLKDETLLKFNKWHVVELLMGNVARFDTYLDICFLSMIVACQEWPLFTAVAFFVCIYLIFPFYSLWKLSGIKETKEFSHALPTIERCCKLAFIRENMLLATVLDSFCISNNIEILKKKTITIGRAMGIWTFLTQDFPQYIIHLLFIFKLTSRINHYGLTVLMSLVVSTMAIGISAFNCIMCAPNEFDPMIVELEFKKRSEADKMIGQARDWIMHKFRNMFIVPKGGNSVNSGRSGQSSQFKLKQVGYTKSPRISQISRLSKKNIQISTDMLGIQHDTSQQPIQTPLHIDEGNSFSPQPSLKNSSEEASEEQVEPVTFYKPNLNSQPHIDTSSSNFDTEHRGFLPQIETGKRIDEFVRPTLDEESKSNSENDDDHLHGKVITSTRSKFL